MTMSDWIQASIGVVLTLTLFAVCWYAAEARRQAESTKVLARESLTQSQASQRIADASLRPVLIMWLRESPFDDEGNLMVEYSNVGNGPAFDISWYLYPEEANIDQKRRVGMGPQDSKGIVVIPLRIGMTPSAVVALYFDVNGTEWASKLALRSKDGVLGNGSFLHGQRPGTKWPPRQTLIV